MLMNIECSIVQSIKVALTFDNNKTKEREIAVGDLCYFEFNKNGKRKTIEGKVIKIAVDSTLDPRSWFIVVDGSLDFSGQMERFSPNQILDVDIIQKHDTIQYVSTPNDATRVSSIRIYNGQLQISTDDGYSWLVPVNLDGALQESDDEDTTVVETCKPKKKKKKPVYIVDDDEDSDDSDEEEDEETDSDDTDDYDTIEDESY